MARYSIFPGLLSAEKLSHLNGLWLRQELKESQTLCTFQAQIHFQALSEAPY